MRRARPASLWVLLALAGPLHAACPPEGDSVASLEALKASSYEVPDANRRGALARGLLACLADPDPAIRDGIAYDALTHWLRAGQIDNTGLQDLRTRLLAMLEGEDAEGFRKPFAALVLSEVARNDRIKPWMTTAERAAMVVSAVRYVESVRDYRGFDPQEGWRHGVAHGADWLTQLAMHPALDRTQADRILEAVAAQAVPDGGHAYVFGEPRRLGRVVLALAQRERLSAQEWRAWLDTVIARQGKPGYTDPAWLVRRHDLTAFLNALYVDADRSDNAAERSLTPLIADALSRY